MRKTLLLSGALLAFSSTVFGAPVFSTGTPNFNNSGLSPKFGTLINFDDAPTLADVNNAISSGQAGFLLPSSFYSQAGVASITNGTAGLLVEPYSEQSGPDFVVSNTVNGTADIRITLGTGATRIGIGIADFDNLPITLNALGAGGTVLASATVTVPTNSGIITAGNGYYVFSDTLSDIQGLEILQATPDASSSGLAVDDLQFATVPEPMSWALAAIGALMLGLGWRRRKTAH